MKNLMITLGLMILMSLLLGFQTELNVKIWKNLRNEPLPAAGSFPELPETERPAAEHGFAYPA